MTESFVTLRHLCRADIVSKYHPAGGRTMGLEDYIFLKDCTLTERLRFQYGSLDPKLLFASHCITCTTHSQKETNILIHHGNYYFLNTECCPKFFIFGLKK